MNPGSTAAAPCPESGSFREKGENCEAVQVDSMPKLDLAQSTKTEAVKSISTNGQMDSPTNSNNAKKNWLKSFIQKKSEGLTRRQILICVIFAFVEFFAATVISIQAPFFPDVVRLN